MRLLLPLLLLWVQAAYAGPVEISSTSLIVKHARSQAEFKGAVHLKRDDFDLRCDRLTAYYDPLGRGELQRAEAYGHVRMQQGGKRGSSQEALYNPTKGTVILIGAASVEDADGIIRGETIIHNLSGKGTAVLQGEGGRVRMTLESDAPVGGGGK